MSRKRPKSQMEATDFRRKLNLTGELLFSQPTPSLVVVS